MIAKDSHFLVITTCDDEKVRNMIINAILDRGLSVCIQSSRIESSYIWKERKKREKEFRIEIKVHPNLLSSLVNLIKDMHSYELPEISILPISTSMDYKLWLDGKL